LLIFAWIYGIVKQLTNSANSGSSRHCGDTPLLRGRPGNYAPNSGSLFEGAVVRRRLGEWLSTILRLFYYITRVCHFIKKNEAISGFITGYSSIERYIRSCLTDK